MNPEKIQVVFGEGISKAELIVREGEALKELQPKACSGHCNNRRIRILVG